MDKKIQQFQKLKQVFRGRILVDEPLSEHTYFHIGGPSDFYLYPRDLEDLSAITDFCQREGINRFIIGNGSNLLISDEGFHGIVIDISETFVHMICKGDTVTVGAGIEIAKLLKYCTVRGLSGLEPLVGIPGQVGGGIRLNAGAFGMEICDRLSNVRLLDRFGTLEKRTRQEITVGYRYTDFPSDVIFVEAQFHFSDGNPKEMEAVQKNYIKERREKQPLSLPSAGSVFKRPPGDYAGRLIEESGCKGLRIGDAMVSKKHANFIVNCHLASAQDVLRLIEEVREAVLQQSGIVLELEINLVGFVNR
jgi:UDP-N-acetylmuramate dehydrogenase